MRVLPTMKIITDISLNEYHTIAPSYKNIDFTYKSQANDNSLKKLNLKIKILTCQIDLQYVLLQIDMMTFF